MVSNQGKMRGRSKGLLRMKNLNRGQELVRIAVFFNIESWKKFREIKLDGEEYQKAKIE